MASSLPQKRTTEESAVTDDDLPTMLKRLRLDAEETHEWNWRMTKELKKKLQQYLKFKTDSTATQDQVQPKDKETDSTTVQDHAWQKDKQAASTISQDQAHPKDKEGDKEDRSKSLHNICLCDEDISKKICRNLRKSTCQIHRFRRDSSRRKHSVNLTQSERAEEPTTCGNHLTPASFLQSPNFNFVKVKDGKDKPSAEQVHTSKEVEPTVFAAAVSHKLLNFSSLSIGDREFGQSSKDQPVFSFEGRQGRFDSHVDQLSSCGKHGQSVLRDSHALSLCLQNSDDSSSKESELSCSSDASVLPNVSRRVDLAVDRTCSQEARNDYSVNDLVGYFEHNFFLPKEMSPMVWNIYS